MKKKTNKILQSIFKSSNAKKIKMETIDEKVNKLLENTKELVIPGLQEVNRKLTELNNLPKPLRERIYREALRTQQKDYGNNIIPYVLNAYEDYLLWKKKEGKNGMRE